MMQPRYDFIQGHILLNKWYCDHSVNIKVVPFYKEGKTLAAKYKIQGDGDPDISNREKN